MKAYVVPTTHGLPILIDKPEPLLEEGHVLLKMYASALNHRDVWITKGLYPGIKAGMTMGSDGCGSFEGQSYIVNPGLDWGGHEGYHSPTFRVLGVPDDGTFADCISIHKKYIYPKPEHLSIVEAAAIPLAGVTAFRALFSRAQVKSGEKVLITGIGGGVALMALQMAVAIGCEVFVTSSSKDKIDKACALGAQEGFLYTDDQYPSKLYKTYSGVDVVIDGTCGPGFNALIKICNPGARVVFYGGSAGKIDGLSPQPIFWKQISILGSTMGSDDDFKSMLQFVDTFKIKPVIDEMFTFEEVHQGFKKLEQQKQFGKIVFVHE